MNFISVLTGSPLVIWPSTLVGWAGWCGLLALTSWVIWRGWRYQVPLDRRFWRTFFVLALLVPPASLLVGFRLPGAGMALPGLPQEFPGPALMVLAAIPWALAAGLLGPLGGALIGAFSGVFALLFAGHSWFIPLETALMAALFSLMVRQRFRTSAYRLLSQPFLAALALALLYPLLYITDAAFLAAGTMAARLDYALTTAQAASLAFGAEALLAGLVAQVCIALWPAAWGRERPLEPSPAERSLQARFQTAAGALLLLLLISLLAGTWVISGRAARAMLSARMSDVARTAAESVPFFLETGQSLASGIAGDPDFQGGPADGLETFLGARMLAVPYFTQFIALDENGDLLAAYPAAGDAPLGLSAEEANGVRLAQQGVPAQAYTLAPDSSAGSGRVSYIAAGQSGDASGRVLVARTDLASSPVSEPFVGALEAMADQGGEGALIDENGRIIFHSDPALEMSPYLGQTGEAPLFFDATAPDGTRTLVYYEPVPGTSWAVALTVPARVAQQLALNIAAPLSLMVIMLALAAFVFLRIGLRSVSASLQNLAGEAERIAAGDLDHPLTVTAVDEVGQLTGSFEEMRASLAARLDELNRLLTVSQGVASSLDLRAAIQPVLEAALATGATAVRALVIPPAALEAEQERRSHFAAGAGAEAYAHLDADLMRLVRQQEQVVLSSLHRVRGLDGEAAVLADPAPSLVTLSAAAASTTKPQPASLIAIALRQENHFYGVLWAAFDKAHSFSEPDVRYFSTLAGQAALAAANAHLFLTAEVGRQRLAAILASTPDPVLVIDSENRLLLANPAALQALGVDAGQGEGRPAGEVITQKPLLDILLAAIEDKLSTEVEMPGGQTYLAIASPVVAEGRQVGRVCILRDVTHFKELDTLKTEFVSTVSHDLRSPLTLMRGYATMLEMVGDLNEQQKIYTGKIIVGVENMTRLVNNLLDLGRIEAGVGLRAEAVDVAEVIDRVIGALQPQAAQKNINLQVSLPASKSPVLQADPALLQQAVHNVVENAIKYTPPAGKVIVRLAAKPEVMRLEIRDTGIGILAADLPRLFEKFYRGSQREARQEKGSGLGLAIARSIVEKHGGKIWVESQPGHGSSFFIEIPWGQAGS